ncbi:PP2C family serine/threonine-protein phosphatase [Streptomyces sp. NBC_01716]|uniref:PP2C family serine/threonine-protein phosphatase n=1 Tax=Streptomyces sp. NBC_01716 TaxID=2975917 RepID=UPI002E3578CE|nr:PP2C family serine/threonine-protein phosphatase [Streptomyces sp. NBC_01716]
MSQMHQPTALSRCPGCEEPLESGDLFCGACGYDLSAVPPPPDDHPTIVINGAPASAGTSSGAAPSAPASGAVDWPSAARTDGTAPAAPVHLPGELPGLDSAGVPLSGHTSAGYGSVPPPAHAPPAPPASPAPAGDFELPAPAGVPAPAMPAGAPPSVPHVTDPPPADPADPRTAPPAVPAGTKLCVACRAGHVDTDGYCENCGHAQPRERDHLEQELDAVAAVSDRGLRHHRNEDAFAVSSAALPDGSPAVIAIVCDGVSSATRPDEASAAASSAANELLLATLPRGTHPQQAMHEAIVAAAEAVNLLAARPGRDDGHEAAHRAQNAPACTIVGAVVASGLLVIGWVGDSRAYWVPDDRTAPPARLTEDDSWAAQMVAAGLMNEAEAYADERAHAITGWLGADAYELEPHTASFKPDRSGVVVVCTDGLWNYAESPQEMARALPPDAAQQPLRSAQVLVGHALDGGGHDNVTVALLPFAVPQQGAGSAYSTA